MPFQYEISWFYTSNAGIKKKAQVSKFCIMVYNMDRPENFKTSIERTGKAAFQALNLSLKPYRPLLGVLKTDQEVFYLSEVDLDLNFIK